MSDIGHSTIDTQLSQIVRLTANLAQAAGTYDLGTVSGGGILIEKTSIYVATAGTLFTSVAIQTNQTNTTSILTAAEGALANIISQKVIPAAAANQPIYLASGQKLQYVLVGLTGVGSLLVTVQYRPVDTGARLA